MPGPSGGSPMPAGVWTLVCAKAADAEIIAPNTATPGENRCILRLPFSSCDADRETRYLPP
jgi:hypothetical protein